MTDEENLLYGVFSILVFMLEELLERPVEVVTTESLGPYIGPRILNEVEYVAVGV